MSARDERPNSAALAVECPRCHSLPGVACAETVNGRSMELREVWPPHEQRAALASREARERILASCAPAAVRPEPDENKAKAPDIDELYERALASPEQYPAERLLAQLDLDGGLHEIAPEHEAMRLFDPAPAQMPGQSYLSDAELYENDKRSG